MLDVELQSLEGRIRVFLFDESGFVYFGIKQRIAHKDVLAFFGLFVVVGLLFPAFEF